LQLEAHRYCGGDRNGDRKREVCDLTEFSCGYLFFFSLYKLGARRHRRARSPPRSSPLCLRASGYHRNIRQKTDNKPAEDFFYFPAAVTIPVSTTVMTPVPTSIQFLRLWTNYDKFLILWTNFEHTHTWTGEAEVATMAASTKRVKFWENFIFALLPRSSRNLRGWSEAVEESTAEEIVSERF